VVPGADEKARLAAIVKKTWKTPAREPALARSRMNEVEHGNA
jgi:phage-related protein